jgi:hypothetical protein
MHNLFSIIYLLHEHKLNPNKYSEQEINMTRLRPEAQHGWLGPEAKTAHASTTARAVTGHHAPVVARSVLAHRRLPDGRVNKLRTHRARVTCQAWWQRLGLTRAVWHQ